MKITLIGRPGTVTEKGNVIVTTMQSQKSPPLPKALPSLPSNPTVYAVYIARKQWRRVEESIKDPEDQLIIEGYPIFDKDSQTVAVFAIHTTTRLVQAAKRESQRTESED